MTAKKTNPVPQPVDADTEAGRELGGAHGPNTPADTPPQGKPAPAPVETEEARSQRLQKAGLRLDKDALRQIAIQASGFLKIFGGAYPRLRAIAALIDALTKPEIWDIVWQAFANDPAVVAALTESLNEAEADFKGLGTQSDSAAGFLSWLTGKSATADKGADYYQTRSAIAGILMVAMGFAAMTRTQKDDDAVKITLEIFTLYFDQYWDRLKNPNQPG